jgi:predicted RNA binding protein YcfA (HicA-like mRNA interferase family)
MVVKSNKLEKALSAKGFQKSTNKHHHKFYIFYCDDKKTDIYTFISHGANHDISPAILSKIKKQLLLDSMEQLMGLIECPLQKEDLERIYDAKGKIQKARLC